MVVIRIFSFPQTQTLSESENEGVILSIHTWTGWPSSKAKGIKLSCIKYMGDKTKSAAAAAHSLGSTQEVVL